MGINMWTKTTKPSQHRKSKNYIKCENLQNVEIKEAKWFILALFETVFWKLELLRKCWSKEAKWCIRTLFWRMWSTSFRWAIACGNMFITEITLNKTLWYTVVFCLLLCHRSILCIGIKINTTWVCIVFNFPQSFISY